LKFVNLQTLVGVYSVQNTTGLDGFFRDKDGNVVIIQPPNLIISTWALASISKLVFPTGSINGGLDFIATIALFIWAGAELFIGDSGFRRTLGAIVLVGMILSKFTSI
jgi:hypothetical protein